MSAPINIAQSHRNRIGCSLIAQASGVSRWGTRHQLWEQYTGRAEWPDISGDLRVALGEPMENVLRPFVAARLGRELRRDRREYLHPDLPLIGHLDYRAERLDGESKRPVVDMKTSLGFGARHRFGEDGTDEVDDDVLLQVQGYLMLTGAETAFVAALVPGPELKIYTIKSDPEMQGMIAAGIAEFWGYVQSDTPPPPLNEEEARQRWVRHQPGKLLEADDTLADTLRSLAALKRELAALERSKQELQDRIIPALIDADSVTWQGRPLCTFRANKDSARIDWRAVAEAVFDEFDLAEDYRANAIDSHTVTTPGARVLRLSKELSA